MRLDPIQTLFSIARWPESCETPYLDVLYNALVPELSLGAESRRGEGVWGDVQERATAGIGDVAASDGDWLVLAAAHSQAGQTSGAIAYSESGRAGTAHRPRLLCWRPGPWSRGLGYQCAASVGSKRKVVLKARGSR
jgi:hypothetical protein